jgi:hypothetical protein
MLPDFICVGASKSGTTTLHDILSLHPKIYLPEGKETQFFVKKQLYKKGVGYYEYKYFPHNNIKNIICGEICPQYMSSNKTPERIYNELGSNIKLIFMLRDPIERSISHYTMKTRTFENLSFDDAILRALRIGESDLPKNKEIMTKHLNYNCFEDIEKNDIEKDAFRYSRYIYPGLYATILEEYLKYFPKENIIIVLFNDFISNTKNEIYKILRFLNVDENIKLNFNIHSNKKKIFNSRLSKNIRNLTLKIPIEKKEKIKNKIGERIYRNIVLFAEKLLTNKKEQIKISNDTINKLKSLYLNEVTMLEKKYNINLNL